MKHPTVILENTSTGRFHPMPFRIAKRPSDTGYIVRFRSIGHHTEGLETLTDAKMHIQQEEKLFDTGIVYQWDGASSPFTTLDFDVRLLT